jgi:HAD superfamily hydrolase (TIGR01484 family)
MRRYKKILFDLDGTLLNQQGILSDNVYMALQKAKDSISISFCTGRTPDYVIPLARSIGIISIHIVDDGSRVIDSSGETLWAITFPQEVVNFYVDLAAQYNFSLSATVDGKEKLLITKNDRGISRLFPYNLTKNQVDVLLSNVYSSEFEVKVVWFDEKLGYNVSITHIHGNKKDGIEYLLNHENLIREEVAGVGDSINDLPLFESVGYKIVMGNAGDMIKSCADIVVPSVDDDGAIEALRLVGV